jgi:hypothetical protein
VLAWLDEVETYRTITSDQVDVLDKRFATLYSLDPGGFFYVARDVDDAYVINTLHADLLIILLPSDVQALFQLLRFSQPRASEHLHQELEHCANVQKSGTSEWVVHLAESPVLRRAARDLSPNAAQCLMLIVKNVRKHLAALMVFTMEKVTCYLRALLQALTSDYHGNPELIKLLQDVSCFSGSFPQYLRVRNVQQSLFGGFVARGSEGSIQRVAMGSESVVVKSPRYSSGGQPSKHEMWSNRQVCFGTSKFSVIARKLISHFRFKHGHLYYGANLF